MTQAAMNNDTMVTPSDLIAQGYRVVEATNEYVEGGWLAIPPGNPSYVGICATDEELRDWGMDRSGLLGKARHMRDVADPDVPVRCARQALKDT